MAFSREINRSVMSVRAIGLQHAGIHQSWAMRNQTTFARHKLRSKPIALAHPTMENYPMSWMARLGKHHARRRGKRARDNSAALLRPRHYLFSFSAESAPLTRICRFSITMEKRSAAVHESGGEHNLCGYMTFAPRMFTVEFRFIISLDELRHIAVRGLSCPLSCEPLSRVDNIGAATVTNPAPSIISSFVSTVSFSFSRDMSRRPLHTQCNH